MLWLGFEPAYPNDKLCKLMVAIVERDDKTERNTFFCAVRSSVGRCLVTMSKDTIWSLLTQRERAWIRKELPL
jgi:hypothetical protein